MTNQELERKAIEARREYQREWRRKNAERLKKYHKEWRDKNKEKVSANNMKYWKKKALEKQEKGA